ncbi:MAG: hypothetical protein JWO15_3556 [Sphingomonadales bacterium]|nr:hypothetical protein [Sphingomonadales bacterium]
MSKVLRIVLEFNLEDDDAAELLTMSEEDFTQECIETCIGCDTGFENFIVENNIVEGVVVLRKGNPE